MDDGGAFDVQARLAPDRGVGAAAEHVAVDLGCVTDFQLHGTRVGVHRQGSLRLAAGLDARSARAAVAEAQVGQQAAAHDVALDEAAVDEDVGVLLCGHQQACEVVVRVVACRGAEGVGYLLVAVVARAVVAVVVAVAAAVDAALHHSLARDHEVGRAVGLRAYVAAHVVAGHDVAVVTASHVDTAGVLDVGPAAAAVQVVGYNLRVGVGSYHRADLVGHREEGAPGKDVPHGADQRAYVEVCAVVNNSLGQGLVVGHVALAAAAVDRAHAAGVQAHERHVLHRRQVVAAVEVVHIEDTVVGVVAVPQATVVGGVRGAVYRGVGVDEVAVHEGAAGAAVDVVAYAVALAVDEADGVGHRGVVAAHEGGVHHAAAEGHLGVRAVHHVAAAEEVADAEVAAVAVEVGVGRLGAVRFQLGAAHVDKRQGRMGYGAAVVVAAEGCQHGAAVDVEGHGRRVVAAGRRDAYEGVLGAAEERVDVYVVVVLVGVVAIGVAMARHLGHTDVDVRGLDVGYGAAQLVAHKAVAVLHQGEVGSGVGVIVEGAGGHHLLGRVVPVVDAAAEGILAVAHVGGLRGVVGPVAGGSVIGAAVAVVAAAAAVEVVDVYGVLGGGVVRSHLYGGAFLALHPSGDVVAAVDGVDGVGVVHHDVGVAGDVGHLAAAHHIALDDGGLRGAYLGGNVGRGHGDGGGQFLRGAVVVVHLGGDGGRRGG